MARLPNVMCIFPIVFPLNPDVPRVRSCECGRIHEGVIPSFQSPYCSSEIPIMKRDSLFRTTLSFHRPRSQMEYSAGYFVAADSRILQSR